ncbi:MAG: delta-60 repeat domain-containing protein [Acidobacteriota bacterium]
MTNRIPPVLGNARKYGSVVRNYLAAGLIGLLLVSTMMRTVEAADGDLDTTFGSGGIVRSNFFFNAIAIQSDGRMIAAGGISTLTNAGFEFDFALARYNINGSLDPTFGSGGKVTTHFPTVESVRALAIQGDGKIIASGVLGNLARYTSDGSLDATFGAGGKVKAEIDVFSVALQSNGQIVVAGDVLMNPSDTDFALARYNADGSPDLTFGPGGKVVTAFSSSYDFALDVLIQNDGKIVAVGYSNNAGSFAVT